MLFRSFFCRSWGIFFCWKKDIGFFERTGDMVFALERQTVGKKVKQVPVIRRKN